jgi:alpha-D-ribose 1-methylphosphonate 5-triphosphate synthase subunit PhnL
MTEPSHTPSLERIEQRSAKMKEICLMFDAQIALLDEAIAQLEAENSQNPINIYRQKQVKQSV